MHLGHYQRCFDCHCTHQSEPGRLRRLSPQADPDCPFLLTMLGSKIMAAAYPNSVNSGQLPTRGIAALLQSASAEVWIKFLLALLGLGLAFGAALFSTALGEAGKIWGSVVLASLALLT